MSWENLTLLPPLVVGLRPLVQRWVVVVLAGNRSKVARRALRCCFDFDDAAVEVAGG